METEIIEGNKLIAEFMGAKKRTFSISNIEYYVLPNGKSFIYKDLQYHDSWDWIMHVWKKIISLGLRETEDMCIREPWGYMQDIRNALSEAEIKSVYDKVVTLIKWYNQTK